MTDSASEPWSTLASAWNQLGPPLRPRLEDVVRIHTAWVRALPAAIPSRHISILCLGVTPEIAAFSWAPDFRLTAIDSSDEMIRLVWPGDNAGRKAVHGDWFAMPFGDASFDLIVTDTGLALAVGVERLRSLADEMRRVLRRDGRIAMRHFARPSSPQTLDGLMQAAEAGRLENFHEFKLRLLMAVESGTVADGVRLSEVYERFQHAFPDRARLAAWLDCDLRTVSAIDAYRGRDFRYAFHSLAEVARAFEGFGLTPGLRGQYPAADICPVFALSPKS